MRHSATFDATQMNARPLCMALLTCTAQVGIIPTDTLPAIVADLDNRDAVMKLYAVKEMNSKKPLSVLCRNFQDISFYTAG